MWEEVPWPGARRIGTGLWGECQHPALPAHSAGSIVVSALPASSEMSACLMTSVLVLLPVSLSGTGGFWLLGAVFQGTSKCLEVASGCGKSHQDELQAGELFALSSAGLQPQRSLIPQPKGVCSR